ncbi:MAG: UDP-2,3-diacylglucosamine diphosphatase [Gemmatimonadota bacterium]|nr:UDP-2,3-diacylglucosamine diphosphatase [Gemmatimonadota bacterium]
MLTPPCYVISDVHLGHAPEPIERALLSFLRSLPGRAGSLLINGDLFEFWFEWKTVVPRSGVRVLAALMDLRDAGIPMTMLAGNHDCWGGDFLREAGVNFGFGPLDGVVGGWRAHVEHGDGLREKEDRGYRALRRVLRNRTAIRAFGSILHPDFASRLAMGSSHTSRTYTSRDQGRGLRTVASSMLDENPSLELVVFGHSHVASLERLSGGVYGNAGSWLDRPTYLVATPSDISLRVWDGSPEGANLHTLQRVAKEALP